MQSPEILTLNAGKLPNSDPRRVDQPQIDLRSPAGLLLQWAEGMRRMLESLIPYLRQWQAASAAFSKWFVTPLPDRPSATLSSKQWKRGYGGRKAIEGDDERLILMAQLIDAGLALDPTGAAKKLAESDGLEEHNRKSFIPRLVRKFNRGGFQGKLSGLRQTPEWRVAVQRVIGGSQK
jgi:hypothetical protein